jgi:hypothetical protein
MTDYVTTREEYGRTVKVLDIQAFARDLAEALGARVIPPKADDCGTRERWASIAYGGCEIGLTRGWRNNEWDKVTVRIAPLDCKLTYNELPRGDEYKLPEATLTATRPMARIVADIKRRIITPADAPIQKRREYAAQLKAQANNLALTAASLRVRHPGLQVTAKEGETYSGAIYRNDGGTYLSGRFYNDGTVSIDRLGTLTADQFARVMDALYAEGK